MTDGGREDEGRSASEAERDAANDDERDTSDDERDASDTERDVLDAERDTSDDERDVPDHVAGGEGGDAPAGTGDEPDVRDGPETRGEDGNGSDGSAAEDADEPGTPDEDGTRDLAVPEVPDVVARATTETPESPDDEVEPVEVLVQLARDGEIDPWDVDIVAVTDAFLARIEEADLRTSARALFYASVLLRMKGDAMMGVEESGEDAEEAESPPAAASAGDPIEALEAEMDRRLDRKSVRGSPETLDELVRELRDHERRLWWKESRTYDTSGSPSGFRRGTQTLDYHTGDEGRMTDEPTEQEVTGTTHAEDIEAVIDQVRAALREHYDAGRDEVLYAEVADAGGSRVATFLALLFLAHRGEVHLQQDELFGDLWVRDPAAESGRGEALAG